MMSIARQRPDFASLPSVYKTICPTCSSTPPATFSMCAKTSPLKPSLCTQPHGDFHDTTLPSSTCPSTASKPLSTGALRFFPPAALPPTVRPEAALLPPAVGPVEGRIARARMRLLVSRPTVNLTCSPTVGGVPLITSSICAKMSCPWKQGEEIQPHWSFQEATLPSIVMPRYSSGPPTALPLPPKPLLTGMDTCMGTIIGAAACAPIGERPAALIGFAPEPLPRLPPEATASCLARRRPLLSVPMTKVTSAPACGMTPPMRSSSWAKTSPSVTTAQETHPHESFQLVTVPLTRTASASPWDVEPTSSICKARALPVFSSKPTSKLTNWPLSSAWPPLMSSMWAKMSDSPAGFETQPHGALKDLTTPSTRIPLPPVTARDANTSTLRARALPDSSCMPTSKVTVAPLCMDPATTSSVCTKISPCNAGQVTKPHGAFQDVTVPSRR
mmetsp:Transcript_24521/g.68183  ORF Transcript_24521/g.68183 Transcript_24521/m.68183 type:complete len:445 (-) Transcript_24521:87-1421(-)